MIRRIVPIWFSLLLCLRGGEIQSFDNCTLVPTEWADGDSFSVRFPDGKSQTVRLYGVDCIEMHVSGDDSNAKRLRDQRRYFGIAEILVAKSFGEAARDETLKMLKQPFTVHTAFADGKGDARFDRIYAFVETADGVDLSEWLVSQGLARAFGVRRVRPDGTRAEEWRQQLGDLELTAARAGRGVWAKTDWDRLSKFRKEAREESAEMEEAKGDGKDLSGRQVDINHASRDELMSLPGIGEKSALSIIEARPYRTPEDLLKAKGIGPATLERIRELIFIPSP